MSGSFSQVRKLPSHHAVIAATILLTATCAAVAQSTPAAAQTIEPAYVSRLLRNSLWLGTDFEHLVNRPLRVKQDLNAKHYDFAKYAKDYFESAISPENLISNLSSSATGASIRSARDGFSANEFERHLAESLTRKSISGSIDFLTASILQEDVRFVPSGEHGLRKRVKYAFLQSFIARGREGNEVAVPRIAASFGTAWVLDTWHPWVSKQEELNLPSRAGLIFSHYIIRSFWTEFKPDIKHEVRAFLKRDRDPLF